MKGSGSCGGQVRATQEPSPAPIRLLTREVSLGRVLPGIIVETLTVSPDSRRVAYWAWKGEKRIVGVDGQEGPEYDLYLWSSHRLVFDDAHCLHGLAVREGEILRVEIEIVPAEESER